MNPNERDRIGSLIQLYSVGHQDTALTYRPEVTLFHREYKQHMGFGTHHVNLPKESATNFLGSKDAFVIPRQGTYLSNMSLMILFRDNQVGNQLFLANNEYGVLELISDITFRVGNDIIDSVTPEQIVLEHSLFQGTGRWAKLSEALRGHELANGEIEVLIPIPFWFCHWKPGFDNGSKFPLYPLSPGVPLEVSVTWKDKNLAKCICSSNLTRYIELWVDYITCPQIEVDYLQTDSQEDLIMSHSQATRDIREKDQRVDIPFRHICKQLCWGFKHDVDLVDYIQTTVETDKSVRERLRALEIEQQGKVSASSIIAALDGRVSHQTLLFEKNLLCNVQNKGFLLHHFTLDKTLHDYIEKDYPRLLLVGHTPEETELFVKTVLRNEGDYLKESFFQQVVVDPSDTLFRRVYGPYLQGVRCKDVFYTTACLRTDKDLTIEFRVYPVFPTSFLHTWSEEYMHPICMINTRANSGSFELRYDRFGLVFVIALGKTFFTGFTLAQLAWTDIQVVFRQATTLVFVQATFKELPITMPPFMNYWISFGNFVSVQRVRDETVKTIQAVGTNQSYPYLALPKEYTEEVFSFIVATTENYVCTTQSIYYKGGLVRDASFSQTGSTFAFEDVTGRLTLFFGNTVLCINQKGQQKYNESLFSVSVEDAVADDTKQWIFVKSGDEIIKFNAHTLEITERSNWSIYRPDSVITPEYNLICFEEKLYIISYSESYIYFGIEKEFTYVEPGSFRLSSVVADGIVYASTGTRVIRYPNMFTESINSEVLDVSGISGFEQVHSMYFYDSYLYLYVECTVKVNPAGEYTETTKQTTMGVIRIVTGNPMYVDTTFGDQGLQPLFSGLTCKGLPEFKFVQKTFLEPFPHRMVGKTSTWLDSNKLSTIDLGTQFTGIVHLPVAPVGVTMAVDASEERVMLTTRSSVVTLFTDSTYDFDFYVVDNETPVRIRCKQLTGLYHNNTNVYLRDSFIGGGWNKLVYSHPLYNSHYAVFFTDADHLTHIRFCSVTFDASFNVKYTVPQFNGIDFSKLQHSFFQDKVIYTYNNVELGIYTYMRLPMYVPQNFYKTSHLSIYTDGMNALTYNENVIVFSKSTFFFNHYVHKNTHQIIKPVGYDEIYSLQWVNENTIVAVVFDSSGNAPDISGNVSVQWLRIDSSLNEDILKTSVISKKFTTAPKVTVGKVTTTRVELYIEGVEYTCERVGEPFATSMPNDYVYYRHTGSPNRFFLCKVDNQVVLRDLNKEYQDYPFYLTPTDEMPIYLHYDSSNNNIFVRIGFAMWKFCPVRPEAVLAGSIHRPFHVSRDVLHAYAYCKEPVIGYGSRLELPPPKLRPVDENSTRTSFFYKFHQEQFARRQLGYYLSDIRISNETSRKRENLHELWSSVHDTWIFEVYTVNVVGISIEPLYLTDIVNVGEPNSLTFYDVFGNSLSEFTSSTSVTDNQIKVTFTKPVQVDSISSTRVLGMQRDLQIYVKHSFQSEDLYYFVVDTGLLGVPGQTDEYTFGIENMTRLLRPSIYIPSISLRNLQSMGIPVYNSLAYSPIPATYQLQLGEAILPSEPRNSEYFQTVVPFYTLQNSSSLRPNVYSFAVFPTYFQPSGHYNMSVTDNYLTIRLPTQVKGTLYLFGFMYNIIKHTTECKMLFR